MGVGVMGTSTVVSTIKIEEEDDNQGSQECIPHILFICNYFAPVKKKKSSILFEIQ